MKIWNWLGRQENHNALVIVIAIVTLFFALPYFSRQINNVQIKIDSVETDLQELYNRNIVEEFSFDDLKRFTFRKDTTENHLDIVLKNVPIKNSVMLWFADQLTNPTNYKVEGVHIDLQFSKEIDMDLIKNISERNTDVIVISYTKAIVR